MQLSGFNHKLHILLKKTIEKILTFKINPLRFKILKEEVCIIYILKYSTTILIYQFFCRELEI